MMHPALASSDSDVSTLAEVLDDRYRLVRRLGSGGMGDVYEAEHVTLGRRFAVKLLRARLRDDEEMRIRFMREGRAAGRVEHENIASVFDFGWTPDGAPYLVMEYLAGADLSRIMDRAGPLSIPRAVHVFLQACRGVAAAHAKGVIHRDLKPRNLFICPRDDRTDLVKVLDFGIAKFIQSVDGNGCTTSTGNVMGTPSYMSPEQARGDKEIDHRADIYALGLILHEMLTGVRSHGGDGYNEILYHVLTKEPPPVQQARPEVPDALVALVEKAISKNREDRFGTVLEMADASSRVLANIDPRLWHESDVSDDPDRSTFHRGGLPDDAIDAANSLVSGSLGRVFVQSTWRGGTPKRRIRVGTLATAVGVAFGLGIALGFAGNPVSSDATHAQAEGVESSHPNSAAATESNVPVRAPVVTATSSAPPAPATSAIPPIPRKEAKRSVPTAPAARHTAPRSTPTSKPVRFERSNPYE